MSFCSVGDTPVKTNYIHLTHHFERVKWIFLVRYLVYGLQRVAVKIASNGTRLNYFLGSWLHVFIQFQNRSAPLTISGTSTTVKHATTGMCFDRRLQYVSFAHIPRHVCIVINPRISDGFSIWDL